MSKEQQIDIIIDLLIDFDEMGFAPTTTVPDPEAYAIDWRNKLTNALKDYRKQNEGEWKLHKDGSGTCSKCHTTQKNVWDYDNWQNFCGHCGAKMKGGAE